MATWTIALKFKSLDFEVVQDVLDMFRQVPEMLEDAYYEGNES